MQPDVAFVHVYQGSKTQFYFKLMGWPITLKHIKSRLAVVILMARDNSGFGFACHTRAHSTLTVSQRSAVMLVGVPPELTLISVQTVVTAKKKNCFSVGLCAFITSHGAQRPTAGTRRKLGLLLPPIDAGIICINLWEDSIVYRSNEAQLPKMDLVCKGRSVII